MRMNLALGALAAGNLVVGLLLQWYVVTRLGIGVPTDALFAGMVVPQLVLTILGGSLVHVLVPLLSGEGEAGFREAAWGFVLAVTALFSVIAIVLFVTASFWIGLILPGFSSSARLLTVELTRIQLIGMIFTAAISVLWSACYARGQFFRAEIAPLIASVVVLAFLIPALPRFGVRAAAWASVARTAIPALFLLPALGRWHKPRVRSATTREGWRRLRPLLLGSVYYKTDPLVDRYLSSMAPSGGLSLFYLGQQIWAAGGQIINKAIAAPMVPLLAVHAKAGDWKGFRSSFRRRLFWMTGLTVAALLLFAAIGGPVLRLLIGHGGVTAENVVSLRRVMLGLCGVLIGGSIGQVTSTSFYAYGDTRTPTRLGVWTYTIFLPVKVLAFFSFGLIGLAVATSVYYFANLFLQIGFLERKLGALQAEPALP